jgi:predicted Zn finger-like uncharacterized protein
MSDDKTDILCPHCNKTFSTFLSDFAAKNLKVVCPTCGKEHDAKPPKAVNPGKIPSAG